MGNKVTFQIIIIGIHSFDVSGLPLLEFLEGSNVIIACPCQSKFGSFFRVNERDTIWINGIVAHSKRDRVSFLDGSIVIRDSVASDSGDYVWVCDRDYTEHVVHVIVEDDKKICRDSNVGTKVEFLYPCQTGVGSFSKSNEKGTIWSNGIVAKDKKERISFENQSVIIHHVVPEDQGEYVWVCDDTYWESTVCLEVKDDITVEICLDSDEQYQKHRRNIIIASLIFGGLTSALVILAICIICRHRTSSMKGGKYHQNILKGTAVSVGNKSNQGGYQRLLEEKDSNPFLSTPIYKLPAGQLPTSFAYPHHTDKLNDSSTIFIISPESLERCLST